MRILFILLFFISGYASASPYPYKPLYVKIKDNNICVFTDGVHKKYLDNETLIYLGAIDNINAFHSSYEKTYSNLKMPIIEENCISIDAKEFNRDLPYSIVLETNQSYSERICVKKDFEGNYQLLEVRSDSQKGKYCGNNQYDYSSNSLLTKLKNLYYWAISFFN